MLTNEMLASGSECGRHKCHDCEMERVCKSGAYPCANICRAVLAERKERENNPGVWDDAPGWVNSAHVAWQGGVRSTSGPTYTRTLPKTKAREIAERKQKSVSIPGTLTVTIDRVALEDLIESAIIEAQGGEK